MIRTLVLGAGIVGRAAAWDLHRRGHEVTVVDRSLEAAQRVGDELGVQWTPIDVAETAAIEAALAGADCVVAAVPYQFGGQLARAALDNHCHYFDFGGNPTIVQRQLRMDAEARAAGVAMVPDCGLAPGFANVLAARMIADTPGERVEARIRVGVLPQRPTGALRYQLAFYAGGLINEYAEPCDIIADGAATTVPPLGRLETIDWPGFGELEAFSTAGGTSTMCHDYEGRIHSLEYKTLRYPGHAAVFAAFRELGFFSTEARSGVVPRDLMIDLLNENLSAGEPDVTLVEVAVSSSDSSSKLRLVDRSDDRFSSLARTTAFPATALCHLVAAGTVDFRGAATMYSVADPITLQAELAPLELFAEDG